MPIVTQALDNPGITLPDASAIAIDAESLEDRLQFSSDQSRGREGLPGSIQGSNRATRRIRRPQNVIFET